MLQEAPDSLTTLDTDVWRKWTPIILTYPITSGAGEEKYSAHRALILLTYRHAPETVIKCVLALIDGANEKDKHFWLERKFDDCWDERLAQALLAKAQDTTLKPGCVDQLLSELLKHVTPGAQAYAESLVTMPLIDGVARERAVVAARQLMSHAPDAGWSVVWGTMQDDAEFGREVSEALEYILREGEGSFFEKLSEDQIADYYVWLSRQYPHAEDPVFAGAHFIEPRESIANWRDALLRYLKERGTVAAVDAVERIARELPHLDWLRYVLLDARHNTRRRTWAPLPPAAIIALVRQEWQTGVRSGGAVLMTEPRRIIVTGHLPAQWNGRPLNETPNLLTLLELYAHHPERLACFTGAGLASPLFSRWQGVLEQFVNECESQGKLHYDKGELQDKIRRGEDYLDIADACALALGVSGYHEFIRRRFNIQFSFDDVPPAYRELLELEIRAILTTNWDRIPEVGGRGAYNIFTNRRVPDAIRANAERQKLVMMLHGEANDGKSLVFTREDYKRIIYRNEQPLIDFLKMVFMSDTVLFIGFSFTDPHLDMVLSAIHATHAGNVQPHYVLLPNVNNFRKDALERNYGVRVIPYTPSDESHPEVLQFVRLLSSLKRVGGGAVGEQ